MKVFFDTSAFIKRYVDEPGSDQVIKICSEAEQLILCVLCIPEMISTLNRLVREKRLAKNLYMRTKSYIVTDLEDIAVCNITPEVLRQAVRCLENNPLRAMDALHVAAALVTGPDLFISADARQITSAKKEGVRVQKI